MSPLTPTSGAANVPLSWRGSVQAAASPAGRGDEDKHITIGDPWRQPERMSTADVDSQDWRTDIVGAVFTGTTDPAR